MASHRPRLTFDQRILLYALLGKLADLFAGWLEHYWLRWHPGYQSGN